MQEGLIFIYLFIYLFIYSFIYLFIYLFIHLTGLNRKFRIRKKKLLCENETFPGQKQEIANFVRIYCRLNPNGQ